MMNKMEPGDGVTGVDAVSLHRVEVATSKTGLRVAKAVAAATLVLFVVAWLNRGDLPGVGNAVREAPAGLGVSALVHAVQIMLTALAWRVLLLPEQRPGVWLMARLRWFREGCTALLPAGDLVGQALAARILIRHGVPPRIAAATAMVDLTVEAVTQLFFTLAGLGLLLAGRSSRDMAAAVAASLGFGLLAAVALVLLQRRLPLTRLRSLLGPLNRRWAVTAIDRIDEVQQAIRQLHTQWRSLLLASLCHTGSWVIGSLEIVGVLHLLGHDVGLADGLVVESISQALRSAGFLVPGALGIQEGAIIGACALVGIAPATALVLALVRRARGLIFGLAGLSTYRHWERGEIG